MTYPVGAWSIERVSKLRMKPSKLENPHIPRELWVSLDGGKVASEARVRSESDLRVHVHPATRKPAATGEGAGVEGCPIVSGP